MPKERRHVELRIVTQAEAARILTKKTLFDALKAGWIQERSAKPGKGAKRAKVIYSLDDIHRVEDRILAGEYPKEPLILPQAVAVNYPDGAGSKPRRKPRKP